MSKVVSIGVPRLRKANKSQVAEFFDVSTVTVDAWVRRGCPVVSRGEQGTPWTFDVLDVARWKFGGESADGDREDPDSLSPQDRKAWYDSELKRRALQEGDRELIPIGEVERAVATTFNAIAQTLRSVPDLIERRTGASPDILVAFEEILDAAMSSLADHLSELGPVDE